MFFLDVDVDLFNVRGSCNSMKECHNTTGRTSGVCGIHQAQRMRDHDWRR